MGDQPTLRLPACGQHRRAADAAGPRSPRSYFGLLLALSLAVAIALVAIVVIYGSNSAGPELAGRTSEPSSKAIAAPLEKAKPRNVTPRIAAGTQKSAKPRSRPGGRPAPIWPFVPPWLRCVFRQC